MSTFCWPSEHQKDVHSFPVSPTTFAINWYKLLSCQGTFRNILQSNNPTIWQWVKKFGASNISSGTSKTEGEAKGSSKDFYYNIWLWVKRKKLEKNIDKNTFLYGLCFLLPILVGLFLWYPFLTHSHQVNWGSNVYFPRGVASTISWLGSTHQAPSSKSFLLLKPQSNKKSQLYKTPYIFKTKKNTTQQTPLPPSGLLSTPLSTPFRTDLPKVRRQKAQGRSGARQRLGIRNRKPTESAKKAPMGGT